MATVYALLVGIDEYAHPEVPRLYGCRNDVTAAHQYLRRNTAGRTRLAAELRCDAAATRAELIASFRDHLGQAGPGDTALFWFSGHGSTSPVPPQWWHLEPSGRMQTMLCADSRRNGVPDLLDKELAILLREVAAGGAHVVAVLDCCHAGGATRAHDAAQVRVAPALVAEPDLGRLLPELAAAVRDPTVPSAVSSPDHVALSACRSHQAAYEVALGGRRQGAFSLGLLAELSRPGPAPTYRQLLTGARCQVERWLGQQVPVLYPAEQTIVDQPFLGGEVRPPAATMTMRYADGAWQVDAGSCHGVPSGSSADSTRVAVHGAVPLREARVRQVYAERSIVEPVDWQPEQRDRFPVVLSSSPMPATAVAVAAAGPAAARVVSAVGTAGPGGGPSPHLRIVAPDDREQLPDLVVTSPRPDLIRISGADGTGLTEDIPATSHAGAAEAVAQLEHIARWRQLKALANPTSRLAGGVQVEVVAAEPGEHTVPMLRPPLPAGAGGEITLDYRRDGGDWQAPETFIRLRNVTDRRVYCVLLDLTDRFRVHPTLYPGAFIEPGQLGAAAEGRRIGFTLPPGRAVRPGASVRDWLMLVVVEEEIDSRFFWLPRLGEPIPRRTRTAAGVAGVVERLGLTALYRDADAHPATAHDWWTTLVPVLTQVPSGTG